MGLTDSHGRTINYLRLSVTDRCNMRCLYCMPAEGIRLLDHNDILRYEDLLTIARTAVNLGIEKIRVTGGEPLVRKGILPFLERLASLPGLQQLVLTTNGLHLAEMAESLRRAGVQRLNISLDSLKPETFASITRGADLDRVLAGIDAAEGAGFPLKINMVVMGGINDAEVIDFAAQTLHRPLTVRFIEYMPSLKEKGWKTRLVPGETILGRIGERFSFSAEKTDGLAGPARMFRIRGAVGTFGIITPVTGHFCGQCNRIRVTASGLLRGCLFSEGSLDLKPLLDRGDQDALTAALHTVITRKPRQHSLAAPEQEYNPFAMAAVGG